MHGLGRCNLHDYGLDYLKSDFQKLSDFECIQNSNVWYSSFDFIFIEFFFSGFHVTVIGQQASREVAPGTAFMLKYRNMLSLIELTPY